MYKGMHALLQCRSSFHGQIGKASRLVDPPEEKGHMQPQYRYQQYMPCSQPRPRANNRCLA